eukprot:scaffold324978_cov25-Prasinocladus_malaysianus.AAC.1
MYLRPFIQLVSGKVLPIYAAAKVPLSFARRWSRMGLDGSRRVPTQQQINRIDRNAAINLCRELLAVAGNASS